MELDMDIIQMNTIFINSENSKTSDSHRLMPNHVDKIDLKRSDKYVALSNLSVYSTWENVKNWYKILYLTYQS